MKFVWFLLLILILAVLPASSTAQNLRPAGLPQGMQPLDQVQQIISKPLDVERLRAEQERQPKPERNRFAETESVMLTLDSTGTLEQVDSTTIWRLRIKAPHAWSLNFGFNAIKLSPNAQLAIYSPDYATLQIYTAKDVFDQQLWTTVLAGSEAVIELNAPISEFSRNQLSLTAINRGFTNFGLARDKAPNAIDSGSCNIDVVCPEGDGWENPIKSVVIYTKAGTRFCSGALINNTAQDYTPYVLTANHCVSQASEAPTIVTYWNYQSLICRTGLSSNTDDSAPLPTTAISGSTLRATWSKTDFTLLELAATVPITYNPYWAGWDRSGSIPNAAVAIHHPSTGYKRISFENDLLLISGYSGYPNDGSHWRVIDWDLGTTEGGSSGSPLFDPQQRIIGQLHGGWAACGNNDSDWYGRLAISWDGGQMPATSLKTWLDPLNTQADTLDGTSIVYKHYLPLLSKQ